MKEYYFNAVVMNLCNRNSCASHVLHHLTHPVSLCKLQLQWGTGITGAKGSGASLKSFEARISLPRPRLIA